MKILVTGSAGFIGSATCLKLLDRGDTVIGVDNHSDYYDPALKEDRLKRHLGHPNYTHFRLNISNTQIIEQLFQEHDFDNVIHLAAQAGVRYSIENPLSFIDSNILGFANILEGCRAKKITHLVYASSSSVYGANTKIPFSTQDSVDHPVSLYAATKKSNELMAHSYSHLYNIPSTGLRFFTVYGPWSRPDMAMFKFTKAILEKRPIPIYNGGKHKRDFTYIDDVVEGLIKVLDQPPSTDIRWDSDAPDPSKSKAPWKIYNIGNNTPIELMSYIEAIENALGLGAEKEYLPKQPGDVDETYADTDDLMRDISYRPKTNIEVGVKNFVDWYKKYYNF